MPSSPEQGLPPLPSKIRFHYIKSNLFRVVHADGVWGGITPTGGIQIAFFSERVPIPQQVEFQLSPDGRVGEEIPEGKVAREGIVREVEVDVVINLGTARLIRDWLDDKIVQLSAATQSVGRDSE